MSGANNPDMAHYRKGKRIDNHRRLELLFEPGAFEPWEQVAKERGIKMGHLVKEAMALANPAALAAQIERRRAA